MNHLLATIAGHPEFRKVKEQFNRGQSGLITGIGGTQKAVVIAGLAEDLQQQLLVVSYSNSQANRLAADLEPLIGADFVAFFPGNELFPHEEAYEPEVTAQRVETLGKILGRDRLVVVTSWEALHRRLVPPKQFLEFTFHLRLGMEYPMTGLLERLVVMGYERVEMVQAVGQFSRRGDILDIYPLDRELPVRMEFFGDEIDSLRSFRVEDQISADTLEQVLILPAREGLWRQEDFEQALPQIRKDLAAQVAKLEELGRVTEAENLNSRIGEALERLAEGHQLPGADQFLPWVQSGLVTLLGYLPDARLILDEPVRGRDAFRLTEEETAGIYGNFLEKGVVLPKEQEIFGGADDLEAAFRSRHPLSLSLLAKTPKGFAPEHTFTLSFRTPPTFHGKVELLTNELNRWIKEGRMIMLTVALKEKARRLREVLREQGISSQLVLTEAEDRPLVPQTVRISAVDLETGFEWLPGKLVVLTENEIYGRQKKKYQTRFQQEGSKISSFTDLKVGDYVVHINHGIGRYMGIETLEIAGGHRDYLKIEYAGEDRLFVPTDQINLLQKYIGVEDAPPKVNKLGGSDWQKVKNKVKESIRDMAEQLLELYAQREVAPGHSFPSDTVWQHEFEEAFFYEETPDQLRAVEEIKRDMEREKPMDRLLCGDVGYGKTEVAMRAAFKAMMGGKQVGVLVPTTILAQQHFLTFRERFAGFPVNIRVLSRFQSQREQNETIEGLLKGEVDLVIGTHRLISSDVHFKELGLLIIDEEQRFGVAHKEKLKELRKNVDVLTLTATPIPRTLHMSLVGIRDISIIETPPMGRFPIRTHVLEYNETVIREALQRELDRKGQVYFVYNRVETIERMASYLQNLLPKARIIIAHGQMNEDQLERVMMDFYDNQADILVCTTIIETGLDIPNVNTLIVYDADRFGLAQLYQLRGRVGRSNRIAHAYFCFRKDKTLSENAEKRLSAIREFTELGSGFKIAMRDLEIRGAGNLLGPEQHGQIAAVGFELYCRLLEEAIREKKGEIGPELPEPMVEIPVDAYIPSQYISDNKLKVDMYKKIANAQTLEAVESLADELLDRFGEPPQPVQNLMLIAQLKALAKLLGFASITKERTELVGKLHVGLGVDYEKILGVLQKYRSHFRYQPGRPPVFKWRANLTDPELLTMTVDSLKRLQ
ncbi:transcription-repair coupling factor [Hydrogenispora ethanolica]|uniref:Transcription-repair-coupling factor n=1 Tax=Hydrogenispora ethanolica TaxID=1082276 RepID=A0A4R1SAG5_HYDET|nr:transcription-repair coupling factor [Hydrogenispora ethanolica]TCL76349.1 transcription-repair coupling factor [Hydrogenispora ethanolica]